MSTAALTLEKVRDALTSGLDTHRSIHGQVRGRREGVTTALFALEAEGFISVEDKGNGRKIYTVIPSRERTIRRRVRDLIVAAREAGPAGLARTELYKVVGAASASELDVAVAAAVATGRVIEDPKTRRLTAPSDDGDLSADADILLTVLREREVDGLSPDELDTLLDAPAAAAVAELVDAGLAIRHQGTEDESGDEFWWLVATEHSEPDPGPESPEWNLLAKAAVAVRRVTSAGPSPEDDIVAAGRRAGLNMRAGDLALICEAVGLTVVNDLVRDDLRATNDQRQMRAFALNAGHSDDREREMQTDERSK